MSRFAIRSIPKMVSCFMNEMINCAADVNVTSHLASTSGQMSVKGDMNENM